MNYSSLVQQIKTTISSTSGSSIKLLPTDFILKNFQQQIKVIEKFAKDEPVDAVSEIELHLGDILLNTGMSQNLKCNIFTAYIQVLKIVLNVIKGEVKRTNVPFMGNFSTLLALVFDSRVPFTSLELFYPIISTMQDISPTVYNIVQALISNDLNHPGIPKIWSSVINDYETFSSGITFLAARVHSVPESMRQEICDEVCNAFFNALKRDSKKFGCEDIKDAKIMYDVISKWDRSYSIECLMTLMMCIPNMTIDAKYVDLMGELNDKLMTEETRGSVIHCIDPVVYALDFTNGNQLIKQTFLFLNNALVNAITEEKVLLDIKYTKSLLFSLLYTNLDLFSVAAEYVEQYSNLQPVLINNMTDIEKMAPKQAYNICKFMMETNKINVYDCFIETPQLFTRFCMSQKNIVQILCNAIYSSKHIDILLSIECLFNDLTAQGKFIDDVICIIDSFLILYKDSIFVRQISFNDYIINDLIAVGNNILNSNNTLPLTEIREIIKKLEKSVIYSLISQSKETIKSSIKLSSLTIDIGAKYNVEISPVIIDISKMENVYTGRTLYNPIIRTAFNRIIGNVPPHIQEVINIFIDIIMRNRRVIISESQNTTANPYKDIVDIWGNMLMIVLFFAKGTEKHISVCYEILFETTDQHLKRRINIAIAYACNEDTIEAFMNLYANNKNETSQTITPEIEALTKDLLTILNMFYSQPHHMELIKEKLISKWVAAFLKNAGISNDPNVKYNLCRFLITIEFEKVCDKVKAKFVKTASLWINSIIMHPSSENAEMVSIIPSALSIAVENLKLSNHTIKSCISSLYILLVNNSATSILIQNTVYNLFVTNPIIVLEETFSLTYSSNKIVRETFFSLYKKLIEENKLTREALSKTGAKGAIDFVLDTNIVEEISSKIPSANVDKLSTFLVQGAIIRNRGDEFISRMVDIELKEANESNKNTVLRGNSVSTIAIGNYMKIYGSKWVNNILIDTVRSLNDRISKGNECFEINPNNGEVNVDNFFTVINQLREKILDNIEHPPSKIAHILKVIYAKSKEKLGDFAKILTHGFFFLRFILPPLTITKNLDLDFTLDKRTSSVLLNASVVLMSAVNKGDLNEKKEFFHVFNDFSAETRDLFMSAIERLLDNDNISAKDDDIYMLPIMSEIEIENLLIHILSVFYKMLAKEFKGKSEYDSLARTLKYTMKKNMGILQVPIKYSNKSFEFEDEELNKIMAAKTPKMILNMIQNIFIKADTDLFVFSSSSITEWPINKAIIQDIIQKLYNQSGEFSLIFDFSEIDQKKTFKTQVLAPVFTVLQQHFIDKIKEIIIINCTEQLFQLFSGLQQLKKKVINAEKYQGFATKFKKVKNCIHTDFLTQDTALSATYTQNGCQKTCSLLNKSICISRQDSSSKLFIYDTVQFCDIERIEQLSPEFIFYKESGEKYVLPISDQKFVEFIDMNVCQSNKTHYQPLILRNIGIDINIAKSVAKEELSEPQEGESKVMMNEYIRILSYANPNIAYNSLLHSLNKFDFSNELLSDSETLEYIVALK